MSIKCNRVKAAIQLVLYTPEIPANTGNIVRLCAATGVPLHLVEPLGFSMDSRLLKRAGLDYWSLCQIQRHLKFEEVERLGPADRFHFLTSRATNSFFDLVIQPGDFLVLGPESTGLPRRLLNQDTRRNQAYCIPMPGDTRSLNLATAAGIVVYESLRQLGCLTHNPGDRQCPL